ncbi:MAG: TSUP family transporter, partial [Microbacteriaceae bacterium]|nr:TSUP family transporter [Microbacteriaceae bacterium]
MLLLVALGIVVGAVAQRVAGMGYALTLAPLMVLALGPFDGPMVVNIAGAFSSALVFLQSKRSVDWKQFWILAVPAVIVIVPSAFFSVAFSGPALQIGIGVILLFALATSLIAVKSETFLPKGRLG